MRNTKWVSLSDAERGQLVSMWLLAADHDGVIPAPPEIIKKICFMTEELNINKFTELNLIEIIDANPTPGRRQSDPPKAEAETEAEF